MTDPDIVARIERLERLAGVVRPVEFGWGEIPHGYAPAEPVFRPDPFVARLIGRLNPFRKRA